MQEVLQSAPGKIFNQGAVRAFIQLHVYIGKTTAVLTVGLRPGNCNLSSTTYQACKMLCSHSACSSLLYLLCLLYSCSLDVRWQRLYHGHGSPARAQNHNTWSGRHCCAHRCLDWHIFHAAEHCSSLHSASLAPNNPRPGPRGHSVAKRSKTKEENSTMKHCTVSRYRQTMAKSRACRNPRHC
jgi:hypothetical protein